MFRVFRLKPAPFCKLSAALGSINNSAVTLAFLFLSMFLPPRPLLHLSFYLNFSSRSSCTIRLQWVPEHSFFPGNDAADKLARWGALLVPSAIPCSLSPLISCIHSFFGLEAYCLIEILRHTGSLDFH